MTHVALELEQREAVRNAQQKAFDRVPEGYIRVDVDHGRATAERIAPEIVHGGHVEDCDACSRGRQCQARSCLARIEVEPSCITTHERADGPQFTAGFAVFDLSGSEPGRIRLVPHPELARDDHGAEYPQVAEARAFKRESRRVRAVRPYDRPDAA